MEKIFLKKTYRLKAIHSSMLNPGSRKGPGPLARLAGMLRDINWSHDPVRPGVLTNQTVSFDWIATPIKTIKRLLLYDWSKEVARQCNHGKYFDIHSIDIPLTQKIYHSRVYKDQAVTTGRFFTKDEIK